MSLVCLQRASTIWAENCFWPSVSWGWPCQTSLKNLLLLKGFPESQEDRAGGPTGREGRTLQGHLDGGVRGWSVDCGPQTGTLNAFIATKNEIRLRRLVHLLSFVVFLVESCKGPDRA